MSIHIILFVFLCSLCSTWCFTPRSSHVKLFGCRLSNGAPAFHGSPSHASALWMAKKGSSSKNKASQTQSKGKGKGFSTEKKEVGNQIEEGNNISPSASDNSVGSALDLKISENKIESNSASEREGSRIRSMDNSVKDDKAMEQVFRKYGMLTAEDKKKTDGGGYSESKVKDILNKAGTKKSKRERDPDSPFGEAVLAGIPLALQAKIDNILVTATFGALAFVVLSGVSISLGALTVVFPNLTIPESIDSLSKNVLSPAFTPSLGIFFFFSITFGLFKFAQISSSGTVYRED